MTSRQEDSGRNKNEKTERQKHDKETERVEMTITGVFQTHGVYKKVEPKREKKGNESFLKIPARMYNFEGKCDWDLTGMNLEYKTKRRYDKWEKPKKVDKVTKIGKNKYSLKGFTKSGVCFYLKFELNSAPLTLKYKRIKYDGILMVDKKPSNDRKRKGDQKEQMDQKRGKYDNPDKAVEEADEDPVEFSLPGYYSGSDMCDTTENEDEDVTWMDEFF